MIGRRTIGTVCYLGGIMAIPEPFTKAWGEMIQYNYEYLLQPTERILYNRATVSYHSLARDSMISEMQGDWILMLDADVIFQPDVVAQMLHKMDKYGIDVLVGAYPNKGEVAAPVLYMSDKKLKGDYRLGDWDEGADIIPIDAAGGGCMMISKRAVDRVLGTGESLFAIREPNSEDISFFKRLKDVKIKAYFSPAIKLEHLIYKGLTIDKDYPKELRSKMPLGPRNKVEGFK